jgi:lysophospholipase L1-like esterase
MQFMVKKLLIALVATLGFAAPLSAQSHPKPPDVPAYSPVTPTYRSGTTLNVVGDGSASGGAAPADSYELTEVNPITGGTRTTYENTASTGTDFCLTVANGGSCTEKKFRSLIGNDVRILFDDPERNYGQPGTSHCHTFFGNQSANAYSTYSTLRSQSYTKYQATGGPLNATAYWFPCVLKPDAFGDGRTYVVKPTGDIILYYAEGATEPLNLHKLLLGLRYVGGYDMDYGGTNAQEGNNRIIGLVNTANAQPGTAGRYSASGSGTITDWKCQTTDGNGLMSSRWFKNANGSDPYSGHCRAGDDFWIQFAGPSCWDGVNLWSPTGYDHILPKIWDTVAGKAVCPNGWFRLPELQLQIHFPQQGFSDYGTWVLSSDAAAGTLPGASFHTDWFNGWDKTALTNWLGGCMAVAGSGNTTPHECNSSATGSATRIQVKGSNITASSTVRANMVALSTMGQAGTGHKMYMGANLLKVSALGDSITANALSGPNQFAVSNGTVTVIVHGVSGGSLNTGSPTGLSFQSTVLTEAPKVVTIAYGANDLNADTLNIAQWESDLDGMVAAFRSAGIRVAIASIIPRYDAGDTTRTTNFNSRRATLNAYFKAGVGTRYDAYIDYTTDPCFDQDADPQSTTCYNADGLHPNNTGYAAQDTIYNTVVKSLLGL